MSVFGGRPTLLGHRGMGRGSVDGLTENTVESIVAAAQAGLRWVEFDVRRTRDDALVVGHYPSLADTGGETNRFLADLTLEEARHLGAVTLESVLAVVPEGIGVNLDLKTSMEDALRKAIPAAAHLGVEAVAAHFTSFGPNDADHAPAFRTAEYAVGVAHEAGLEVVAWCPVADLARDLFAAGVDAVVVDDAPRALAALRGVAD